MTDRLPPAPVPAGPVRWRLALGIALAVFVADQLVKAGILYGLFGFAVPAGMGRWHPPIEVTPFFNLVMVWNTGVSFGLFASDSEAGRWALIALACAISAGLAWWVRTVTTPLLAGSIGAVVGGAIGNVVDRLVYGAVADFFDVHAFGYHWPAFNIADSAIVVGVGLILYDGMFGASARQARADTGIRRKERQS